MIKYYFLLLLKCEFINIIKFLYLSDCKNAGVLYYFILSLETYNKVNEATRLTHNKFFYLSRICLLRNETRRL